MALFTPNDPLVSSSTDFNLDSVKTRSVWWRKVSVLLLAMALLGGLTLNLSCGSGRSDQGSGVPQLVAPTITTQPSTQTVPFGQVVSFSVVASGSGPLHFQWKHESANIGTDGPLLTLPSVQSSDAGAYTVTVSNAAGSLVSAVATLTVTSPTSLNLALGKLATASSMENATYPASQAVDGQIGTRWSSAFLDPTWMAIDLGSPQAFNRVVLRWEPAFGKTYTIDVSLDGSTWTTVHAQPSGAGGVEEITFPLTTARHVRMNGSARGTPYGYSLWEFEVYNAPLYTITAGAGAHGTITPAGSVSVAQGQNQTFTVTADGGYTVDTVMVDGVSVGAVATYTFSQVRGPHAISATFKLPASFMITAAAGLNGTISPSGAVPVLQGTSQAFTFTPNPGFAVTAVAVDGASVGVAGSYTFRNVQATHSISVTFGTTGGLVWSDEFDGPEIDATKWAFDLGNGPTNPGPLYGWGNGEWEYYTSSKDNAAIENGTLVITARKQDWGGQPFTSARLVTRGKYSFNHGRFVARIKMPEGNRMWPAFWLLGDRVEDWPKCGEIDIAEMFCGAVGRGDNAVFATAHWWDETSSQYATNGVTYLNPAKLSTEFHDYELVWDEQYLRGKIDGIEYWTLDISGPTVSELRNNGFYLILNLAVGSPGFGMTSASQVDGPMPQKMIVDYIRVYSNPGSTVDDKVASQPHGQLGIMADGTPCDAQIDPTTGENLLLWNNLVAVTGTPAAGAACLAVKTLGTTWFGCGLAATKRRNLLNYAAGYLNLSMKTTSTDPFKIGLNGGNDGDAWVSFSPGADPYGFTRDGQWHRVSIPMTRFGNADFTDIRQFFMVASDDSNGLHVTAGQTYEFDEIYWSENAPENRVRPVGNQLGVYTDRVCDAGTFNPANDGAIFIWNKGNGALAPGVPFEGANAFTFTAPAAQWYGFSYTPSKLFDLSAFAKGHLHIALKVPASSTSDFKIGLKSPGGTAVRESWIKFKNGSDPYGMLRDGTFHELIIPAADFCNSDFSAISMLFMLAGDGPVTLDFDDVYWTAN